MRKLSVSVSDDLVDDLEERVDAGEFDSKSEALRERYWLAEDLEERVDELETDVQHAEARVDELERQLSHEREREDDVQDLATFADVERRRAHRQERLDEARRKAGLVEKVKWSLFGEPDDLEQRADDVLEDVDDHDRADDRREQ